MIVLQGKNLGERQKELNLKVIQAARNKVDFQEVRSAQEYSDIDRLFKIDLASRYKSIDYIIEELKCGDSLYISRALKCEWIYDNEYKHIINPDYLHHNIFPAMSIKMKTKTLSTVSIYVRDEIRAQLFYEYCKNMNMKNIAHKFLIFTSESNKQDFLNGRDNVGYDLESHINLIGNSFVLADIYCKQGGQILDLPYLYSVNDIEYLNLLEKYSVRNSHNPKPFGSKMSRSILKKHKSRILNNPEVYLKVIKKSELVKYTSSDDARVHAAALLPQDVADFWGNDYYKTYKHILNFIKPESIYEFIKQIFSNKYPKEDFEMSQNFYDQEYYAFMTADEKKTWALNHLEKQTSVIPEHRNFEWYKFVEFSQAFKEIKKRLLITTRADNRLAMFIVLAECAKTQRELEELVTFYYKRHVNERWDLKESFLESIISNQPIFEFDDAFWSAFDKLLHSLSHRFQHEHCINSRLGHVSLIYHIIYKGTLPDILTTVLNEVSMRVIRRCLDKLSEEKKVLLYDYLHQYLVDKIMGFESLEYNKEISEQVRIYLKKIIELKQAFKREDSYPEMALKYMNLDLEHFSHIFDKKHDIKAKEPVITEGFLIRCLKKDPRLIIEKLSLIEKKCGSDYDFRLNMLLKKLKIYFSNDVAKLYLEFFMTSLSKMTLKDYNHRIIYQNVFTLFQLGDERAKIEFMDKHAPKSGKIEYDKIDHSLQYTQEGICRFHCYSRPPVPISKTALYLKGDYVRMCNDMLNMYLMNLTPPLRTDFIKFLLDSPVSIQKRGLRLAFKTFETNQLKDLVIDVWGKTKNVSLRSNLYRLTYDKMVHETGKAQMELLELIKELTKQINRDDDEDVFGCFSCREMPEHLRASYLETAWNTVSAFSEKDIERRRLVVKEMTSNMSLMDEAFVESLVNRHVNKRLFQEKLKPEEDPATAKLNEALWDFVNAYITNIPDELKQEKSLNVVKVIVKECLEHWNENHNTQEYVFQLLFKNTANDVDYNTRWQREAIYTRAIISILEYFLESFENQFGVKEMYSYYWDWKLAVILRKVRDGRNKCDKEVYISLGSELGVVVKQLKEKNCYYTSFLRKILGKISDVIHYMVCFKTEEFTERCIKILVAYGLTQHEMFEAFVMALEILPEDASIVPESPENETCLQEVIKAVKKQNSDELTAFMNDKFVYSDLKVRKIMQ